jgi:hypothetical protein
MDFNTLPLAPALRHGRIRSHRRVSEASRMFEDLEVSLDDDVLRIRAESKSESTAEPARKRDHHFMERDYGRVVRSFRLPFSSDPKQVEVMLQDRSSKAHPSRPDRNHRYRVERVPAAFPVTFARTGRSSVRGPESCPPSPGAALFY